MSRHRRPAGEHGTSTLLALVTAIAMLTVVTGGALVIAEDAFRETARGDAERAVALQASERLVAAGGPLAHRPNVVDAARLDELNASDLRALGATDRFAMAVTLDGRELASAGDPGDGHVIRRIVLVERRETVTRTPTVATQGGHEVTLPVRTDEVGLTIDPPSGTTVTTVRSDGRVLLYDESGLAGSHRVRTPRYETLRLTFEAEGPLGTGDVEVTYEATTRERAVLAVAVSDRQRATGGGEGV